MRRVAVASLLALAGAAALVLSAFQPWYEKSDPRSVPIADLFQGFSPDRTATTGTSMMIPLAAGAAIAALALLVRSRLVMLLAGLLALATCVLWTVQKALEVAPVSFDITDLHTGLWNAYGGVLLLLIAVAVLPPRRA
ncbi:hypothetical protein ABTZ03_30220 [Kitasatospora sp. NPDC096077]|uniref:hypothetical protein n=1 Tax=unclassified Kitasatospora TaxID=2633591 RepID=UPI00332CA951